MTITHTTAPLFDDNDLIRRLIHDQQFMDLSERYDPVEPSPETLPAFRLTAPEIACLILTFSSGAAFSLLACVL